MKKEKVIICILSIILLLSVCLNTAFISAELKNFHRVTIDYKTGIEYLHTETDVFMKISQASVNAGYFTEDTLERIEDIHIQAATPILENSISAPRKAFVWNKVLLASDNVYGTLDSNGNEKIYCCEDSWNFEEYYAHPGFEIPELSIENIEKIDLFIGGSPSDSLIIDDEDEVENFLNHYEEIYKEYSSYGGYIKYKNASYVEWFNIYKLKQMLSENK